MEDARLVRPYAGGVSQLRSSIGLFQLHRVPCGHPVLTVVTPVSRAWRTHEGWRTHEPCVPTLFCEEGGDGVVEDGVVSVEGGLRIHVDCAAG